MQKIINEKSQSKKIFRKKNIFLIILIFSILTSIIYYMYDTHISNVNSSISFNQNNTDIHEIECSSINIRMKPQYATSKYWFPNDIESNDNPADIGTLDYGSYDVFSTTEDGLTISTMGNSKITVNGKNYTHIVFSNIDNISFTNTDNTMVDENNLGVHPMFTICLTDVLDNKSKNNIVEIETQLSSYPNQTNNPRICDVNSHNFNIYTYGLTMNYTGSFRIVPSCRYIYAYRGNDKPIPIENSDEIIIDLNKYYYLNESGTLSNLEIEANLDTNENNKQNNEVIFGIKNLMEGVLFNHKTFDWNSFYLHGSPQLPFIGKILLNNVSKMNFIGTGELQYSISPDYENFKFINQNILLNSKNQEINAVITNSDNNDLKMDLNGSANVVKISDRSLKPGYFKWIASKELSIFISIFALIVSLLNFDKSNC